MSPNIIFVFGSNIAGRHGKGAALTARQLYGAREGIGMGRQGDSYAIPTKDQGLRPLPLWVIERHVALFIEYAKRNPNETFLVTAIGTGEAGYSDGEIEPMFRGAPTNCLLPKKWRMK